MTSETHVQTLNLVCLMILVLFAHKDLFGLPIMIMSVHMYMMTPILETLNKEDI